MKRPAQIHGLLHTHTTEELYEKFLIRSYPPQLGHIFPKQLAETFTDYDPAIHKTEKLLLMYFSYYRVEQ